MKDPSRSSTSPSIISEDVIINGHSHEDDNPFAEYMWMENEEEFNRQASCCPPWLSCAWESFSAGVVRWGQQAGRVFSSNKYLFSVISVRNRGGAERLNAAINCLLLRGGGSNVAGGI